MHKHNVTLVPAYKRYRLIPPACSPAAAFHAAAARCSHPPCRRLGGAEEPGAGGGGRAGQGKAPSVRYQAAGAAYGRGDQHGQHRASTSACCRDHAARSWLALLRYRPGPVSTRPARPPPPPPPLSPSCTLPPQGEIPKISDLPAPWGPKPLEAPPQEELAKAGYLPPRYPEEWSPLKDVNA